MRKSISLRFLFLVSIYFFSTFASAKSIDIRCDDPDQCRRKFIAASEWIQKNSLLPIDRFKSNAQRGILVTSESDIEGYVKYNGGQWPKSLAVDFVAQITNQPSLNIKIHCANIFRCKPSEDEVLESLNKYVDDRESIILQELNRSRSIANDKHHSDYLFAFNSISKSADAIQFIANYKEDDGDDLIPRAKELAAELEAKEKELQLEMARTNEAERQKHNADNRSTTNAFRAKVKLGDESHCGMIIDLKLPLVKVQTMVGERWYRLEQIYPRGNAPCQFYNNVYQDVGARYGFE